jgi:hypothetical protein
MFSHSCFQLRNEICHHCWPSYNVSLCYFLQLAVSATVVGDEKSGSVPGMEMHEAEPEAMEECEGEECLMRRTLVAHTDYIYTQGKHN